MKINKKGYFFSHMRGLTYGLAKKKIVRGIAVVESVIYGKKGGGSVLIIYKTFF